MGFISRSQAVPVGLIRKFGQNILPPGFLACDGTAYSRTGLTAGLFKALVTDAGFTSQPFTVTIATPAVFTKLAHGFLGGERIRLSTTGALPTGLVAGGEYFVLYVGVNTFNVSATPGGAAINTTGVQSGTHSYIQTLYGLGDGSTTFNVPDIRGKGLIGSGSGVGLSVRSVGQQLGFETHTLLTTEMPSHGHGVNDSGHSHSVFTQDGFSGNPYVAVPPVASASNAATQSTSNVGTGISIQNAGGGSAHNIMQPTVVCLFGIKF